VSKAANGNLNFLSNLIKSRFHFFQELKKSALYGCKHSAGC